jgi:mannose-1-phosphate guanylyltransferase
MFDLPFASGTSRTRPGVVSASRWSIVLAGGEGTRLLSYVEQRFGEARPKQYCAFEGPRSMLQQTVDRAARLAAPERTVTVVAASHGRWSRPQLAGHAGTVVVQPTNRETAAGVFLPLAWVRARDPLAVVSVLPSDHFIDPEEPFIRAVAEATDLAAARPDRIVLLGTQPDGPETEYGYIEPTHSIGADGSYRRVACFVEKPSADRAAAAIGRGGLWNTMVFAASVDALWEAGRATLPEMMPLFDLLVEAIDTSHEASVLQEIYRRMPAANFSRDVLERVTGRCLVGRIDGIAWSDWGRAERIESTLARLGRAVRFVGDELDVAVN